jgi:Methyltransferase domain
MPRILRQLIGYITGKVTRPIIRAAKEQLAATALYDLACKRAVGSSLHYADTNMQSALLFRTAPEVWEFALRKAPTVGLCLEFGVWTGRSINYFARRTSVIYGFDSFEGLQEDWSGWSFPKGSFDLKGKTPKVRSNVRLIKGWFNDTLPPFLQQHPDDAAFIHIDCDTYEATATVLALLNGRIVPGTVILFDEYFGYRGWRTRGEFTAWQDFVHRTGARYEYVAFSGQQVALRLMSR